MKKFSDKTLFLFFGIYLFLSVLINIYLHYHGFQSFQMLFWYCDFVAILLAFGFLFRKSILITAVMISAIPAQGRWIIDFFIELFWQGSGRTVPIFYDSLFGLLSSVNLHLILIPLSIYGVCKLGFNKKSIYVIFPIMIFILVGAFLFTDVPFNRNCVFYSCDVINFPDSLNRFDYLNYFLFYSLTFWTLLLSLSYLLFYYLVKRFHIFEFSKDA